MQTDQKFKNDIREAASNFEECMRQFISKEEFLRDAQLESLQEYRNSHTLAKQHTDLKIEKAFEFDSLFRHSGNPIPMSGFLERLTLHFRSFNSSNPPIINACSSTKGVIIKTNDLIIFEMTSRLKRKYWNTKLVEKPIQVKELLNVLKKRNKQVGNIFLFLVHDGEKNNFTRDYSSRFVENIEGLAADKKLYYPGFIYVRFEAICKLWLDRFPQEIKMLKALKKTQDQNQKTQAKLKKKQAENKELKRNNENLTKELTKKEEQLVKQNANLEEMRQIMLGEMRKQVSAKPIEHEAGIESKLPSINFEDPSSSGDEDVEQLYDLAGIRTSKRKKKPRNPKNRNKRGNKPPEEVELKESDYNRAYEESQLMREAKSKSSSPTPTEKPTKRRRRR